LLLNISSIIYQFLMPFLLNLNAWCTVLVYFLFIILRNVCQVKGMCVVADIMYEVKGDNQSYLYQFLSK